MDFIEGLFLMDNCEIVLFETSDKEIKLSVHIEQETIWLTMAQMVELFERDISVISRHINNIFNEEEVDKKSNLRFLQKANSDKPVAYYSLDVIISVGYRVKFRRGLEFRKWANSVLRKYILHGYGLDNHRVDQLNEVVRMIRRTQNELDSRQLLAVIEKYSEVLELLNFYDYQNMTQPTGITDIYKLSYEECWKIIATMQYGNESEFFGKEMDDSFKGSIGNIYQSFGGQEIYPTLEEKAAHLLYFVTKDHSFFDGNKRIAATMFLYFLYKNKRLFADGKKLIDDHTLMALTIMIAESNPEEMEMMISLILDCLK